MCGIAGLWIFGGGQETRLRNDVRAMTDAITYRGPDGDGAWIDASAGVALGHRRLAIVDLSPTGYQPMVSADGRIVITYNGELYNRDEMAAELAMTFRGTSDTEVLVEAIARFGIDGALARANGLFAFAAFDIASRTLHIARDHLGIKPLYYTRQGGFFAFASELKALRKAPGVTLTIDPAAVATYMRHACVPAPLSIYREVGKLLPGERAEVTENGLHRRVYWDLAAIARKGQADQRNDSFEAIVDELDGLLSDCVRRQMVSDVPLGAFLSGGVDSSTVVAMMQKAARAPVKTFSIGFREEGYNESDHARAIAKYLGTDHSELVLSHADALSLVPQMPVIYDEPFADSSQLPTYLVSRLAREQVTVALSGDGGDEMFGGYVRYRGIKQLWNAVRHVPPGIRRAGAGAIHMLSPQVWDALGTLVPRRKRPAHLGDKILKGANLLNAGDPIDMYGRLISQWPDPHRLVPGADEASGWVARLSKEIEGLAPVAQMRLLDMMTYMPDDILTKVDRAAMAVSLEVRVPLIDRRIVEFSWRLRESDLIRDGAGKRPLRAVLGRYVPPGLFERPKMGFGVPIGAWLRGPLRGWAEELLNTAATAGHGLFDAAPLRERWTEHLSGRRNWQHALWAVLQFQAWYNAGGNVPGSVRASG